MNSETKQMWLNNHIKSKYNNLKILMRPKLAPLKPPMNRKFNTLMKK